MTWNCEGFRRVSSDLLDVALEHKADLIFISEPHLFQADLHLATACLSPHYNSSLNSADKLDQDLPLTSSRAFGGTLTLWKRYLDPFIKILDVNSASFHVLLLNIPGYPVTVHINIYLPTSGLNADYVAELSKLESTLDEIEEEHNNPIVMIRGDANASLPVRPANSRDSLFKYFCERLSLLPVLTNHKTYHHFVGNGASDSSIDVILHQHSARTKISENIICIICSKTDDRVDSKHDIIVSQFSLPFIGKPSQDPVETPPQIPNTKHKIVWSDEGILDYRDLISDTLLNIQENWKNPPSSISFSMLLQCTNEALTAAAKLSNKVIDLSKENPPAKFFTPPEVSAAAKEKKAAHAVLQAVSSDPSSTSLQHTTAKKQFCDARKLHRQAWRRHQAAQENERDLKLDNIISTNPTSAFKHFKSVRSQNFLK